MTPVRPVGVQGSSHRVGQDAQEGRDGVLFVDTIFTLLHPGPRSSEPWVREGEWSTHRNPFGKMEGPGVKGTDTYSHYCHQMCSEGQVPDLVTSRILRLDWNADRDKLRRRTLLTRVDPNGVGTYRGSTTDVPPVGSQPGHEPRQWT